MTEPGLIPSDAEAAFDEVLARIEALRSETAGRIATLGTSLGFDVPGAPVVAATPPPTPRTPPVAAAQPPPAAPVVHAPTPPVVRPPIAARTPPVARPPTPPTLPSTPSTARRPSARRSGPADRISAVGRRAVAGLATRAATLAAAVAAAAGAAGAAALTTLATVRRAAARTVTTLTQLATDLARTATTAARRAATSATSATSAARRAATTMTTAARRALTTTTAARAPIRTTALTTFATVRRAAARTLTSATRLATDLARTATTTVRRAATTATTAARRTATSTTTATRHVATTATARLRGGGSDLLGDARRRAVQLRAVVARVPARAVPVSLLVLVVAAGGSLALRAADAGRDDAAAAIPDPSTPVAPILPPSSPGPLDGPPPEPEPEPVAPVRRPPSLLRIPSIGVDALTVPVGLEADGSMEIPSDVRTIGWYEPGEGVGVAPGQTGTAVLAGHVDSRTQGAGAFYHLRDLVVGDEIEIEHADGTVSRWRVISVTQYAKDALPIDEVFVWDGPPRLALITCGGAFDWTARSYTDNIVVTATPIDDGEGPTPDGLAVAEPRRSS